MALPCTTTAARSTRPTASSPRFKANPRAASRLKVNRSASSGERELGVSIPWLARAATRFRSIGTAIYAATVLLGVVIGTLGSAQAGPAANARPTTSSGTVRFASFIAEASQRFAVPVNWIRAVIHIESGGRASAVSPRGAMGLMQIMPKTYAGLRARYHLGRNAYDPRDNILAGVAYLREMHDRYGSPGFLAAYNAGPARYDEHLATGRPLPIETQDYVAMLMPMIDELTD